MVRLLTALCVCLLACSTPRVTGVDASATAANPAPPASTAEPTATATPPPTSASAPPPVTSPPLTVDAFRAAKLAKGTEVTVQGYYVHPYSPAIETRSGAPSKEEMAMWVIEIAPTPSRDSNRDIQCRLNGDPGLALGKKVTVSGEVQPGWLYPCRLLSVE